MAPITFRAPTPNDDPAIERARGLAYGGRVDARETDPLATAVREHARCLIGLDGDDVVATSLGYGFSMSVPGVGQELAVAGMAGISVVPTHRRRGILREIMRRNLDAAHARGEPLSVLWPSESPIYRRFGYGPATSYLSWEIERVHAQLLPVDTAGRTVRVLPPDPAKVAETVAPLHDQVRRVRPGMLGRTPAWWARRTAGATDSTVFVCVDGPDGPEAYAAYTVTPSWDEGGPANTLAIGEVVTVTAPAEAALWSYLFGIDLVRDIRGWGQIADSPLPHLVANRRKLKLRIADGAWARLVDLGAALAGRRYAAPADLVLDVTDAFCAWNEGRWHLRTAGPDQPATCERTDAPADLTLDVADLAAAYLGDASLRTLAAGGLVDARSDGALDAADRAFGWSPAAWAVTWF